MTKIIKSLNCEKCLNTVRLLQVAIPQEGYKILCTYCATKLIEDEANKPKVLYAFLRKGDDETRIIFRKEEQWKITDPREMRYNQRMGISWERAPEYDIHYNKEQK